MNESGCSAGNDKVTNSVKCEVLLKCQQDNIDFF